MIADVVGAHATIHTSSGGNPNTVGLVGSTKGMPPSSPTVGSNASQRYRRDVERLGALSVIRARDDM